MADTYTSILAELVKRREAITVELRGVNAAIAAILPLVGGESAASRLTQPAVNIDIVPVIRPTTAHVTATPRVGNYSRLSVRWAALWHLAEFAQGPMRNAEVADAIRSGGYHSGASSFPNAVSAVLSSMRSKGEIDGSPEAGYYLTDKGREIWETIKRSDRFRSVMTDSSSPTEPLLLSVQ
jgi:hypothetical protein